MTLTNDMISQLEKRGFSRWTKAGFDRLYISATRIGLELEYYKTGNVSGAWFNGARISNSQGRRIRECKTYIDVTDGTVHSGDRDLKANAQKILDEIVQAA